MTGRRKKNRIRSDKDILVHKVHFFIDNHWTIEEIAQELKLTITEVQNILLGYDIEDTVDLI